MTAEAEKTELDAYNEGVAAALDGREFRHDCPYTFDKFSPAGMTPQEFHVQKRPLLNAWFKGWSETKRGDHDR